MLLLLGLLRGLHSLGQFLGPITSHLPSEGGRNTIFYVFNYQNN